jgi:hypothetical protein
MMEDKYEARLNDMRVKAGEYAKAYADRNKLEEYKKSELAILMKKAEADGHKTAAAQEREARADAKYLAVLDALHIATEVSEKLRWELEISKLGVAIWQTRQANERFERKSYGA